MIGRLRIVSVHRKVFVKLPIELLGHPKANYTTTQERIALNVKVTKVEKNG